MPETSENPSAIALELSGTLKTTSPSGGRLLPGQLPPQLPPHPVHRLAEDAAVRPGEVHQLEDAAAHRTRRQPGQVGDLAVVDPDEVARPELAVKGGADQIQRAGLRGHHDAATQPADDQRAKPPAVDHGVHGPAHA